MIVKAWNKEYKVHIIIGEYTNKNLAIQLVEDDTDQPFDIITVNLGKRLPYGYANIDINNCPWAIEFIEDNHLGEFTGIFGCSGFCDYPLFRFYEEVIKHDN